MKDQRTMKQEKFLDISLLGEPVLVRILTLLDRKYVIHKSISKPQIRSFE